MDHKPGSYVNLGNTGEQRHLPSVKDFVGRPLTKQVVESARYTVASLRLQAKRLRQYDVEFVPGGTIEKAYGESAALEQRAREIVTLINSNLSLHRLRGVYPLT